MKATEELWTHGAVWETAKSIVFILSVLFPIVNPLGGSPIFLSLTREYSPSGRKALSRRIALNSFFLLVGSYFIGTYILSFFWNLTSGGAGRRWINSHFNRMDDAEAA